jgi:Mn2+/Fe2+ NRAMP family transporter
MKPWSAKLPPLSGRALTGIGAGALVGSFYIGTGDIAIATKMGALFGMDMWWTFFVLGLAGWTLMDMSTRYYLRFGRTPLSIFKEVHPVFSIYLFVTVVVTTIIGAYSQWNTCAHVLGTLNPGIATEVGGTLAALTATALLVLGVYRKVELFFVAALILLIGLFAAAAAAADAPWAEAPAGLLPGIPESGRQEWLGLIQQNAGSLINAWLILIYPYTMIEKGWRSTEPLGQALILQRSRWDYGVGIAAAGIVALPVMAAAAAVARPFGIVPENATELAALLEPLAGGSARLLFLAGFFIAAWTAGIGWMVCGAYAMLDLGNIKVRMESRSFRQAILVFVVASASLLFLRINPVYGIRIFTVLLAVVFPVVALVMVWRISRPDMGYFRWSLGSVRGAVVVGLDIFALLVSLFVGWGIMSRFF